MATREALLNEIDQLDKEMDRILRENDAVQVAHKRVYFPMYTWLLAIGCWAVWMFGEGYIPIPREYREWLLWGAGAFGILAGLFSLRWFAFKFKSGKSAYREANEELKKLRMKRAELQAQLDAS